MQSTPKESSSSETWLRRLLLALALGVGSYLRLRGVGQEALFGDELHTLGQVGESLGTIVKHFDARGSHVVLPFLQHISMQFFGGGLLAMRLPALVPGLLALFLIYPIGVYLVGRTPALLASLALAFSPMHIYYTRFARSYALSALLGMLLVYFLARALEAKDKAQAQRSWLISFGLAACLPYVHLSSAGFVGLAALVSILCAWRKARSWRAAIGPLLGFGAALLLCLAAYAPILDQVQSYLNDAMPEAMKKSPGGPAGILILLAGGQLAAGLMLALAPIGLVLIGRRRPAAALLMGATFVGPCLALWITEPHGMEYAYARYLLTALPFLPMGMAWLLHRASCRCAGAEGAGSLLTLVLGALLIGLGFASGPAFGPRPATPVFDNSYLAMHALPCFDEPWPEAHAFYRTLAADPEVQCIVEYPVLQTRAALLYRQLAFVHGKRVLLGWPKILPAGMGPNVYVSMDSVDGQDADYIILHRDPVTEVKAYWKHVYATAGAEEDWGLEEGFLRRHRAHFAVQGITNVQFLGSEAAALRDRLGPAFYKDSEILVWKLKP